ncbi:MAG TPA: cysteine-rich CWC family protein [Pyrinomonadaceae bacterium]
MTDQKLASFISQCSREPSTCEACGDSFNCGATLEGCWCTEVALSEQARAQLRARYQQCLCRKCLEGFAEADRETTGADKTVRVD